MLVIAHRGASNDAVENSSAAYSLADRYGADAVELDVRPGRGGALLLRHDPLPDDGDPEPTPIELAEGLDSCGSMLVNVEIKNLASDGGYDASMAFVDDTLAELDRRGTPDRWLISSFSWHTLAHVRRVAPEVRTAYLVMAVTPDKIDRVADAGHVAVHPWHRTVDAELVARAHARGIGVNVWTCNRPERIAELEAMGVDGVCTDVPDVAIGVLGRPVSARADAWARPT